MDFAFLAAQTFNDAALEREVLELFLAQARKALPELAGMAAREQNEVAHRLKGSCQGIGARRAAAAAQAYEDAACAMRTAAYRELIAAFAQAEAAILGHLAGR